VNADVPGLDLSAPDVDTIPEGGDIPEPQRNTTVDFADNELSSSDKDTSSNNEDDPTQAKRPRDPSPDARTVRPRHDSPDHTSDTGQPSDTNSDSHPGDVDSDQNTPEVPDKTPGYPGENPVTTNEHAESSGTTTTPDIVVDNSSDEIQIDDSETYTGPTAQ